MPILAQPGTTLMDNSNYRAPHRVFVFGPAQQLNFSLYSLLLLFPPFQILVPRILLNYHFISQTLTTACLLYMSTCIHTYVWMYIYIFKISTKGKHAVGHSAARTGISISATCIPSLLAVLGKKRKTSIPRYNPETRATLFLINVTFHCFYLLPGALAGISSWKVWCSNMS